ncbi:MAG: hypothetical protein PVI40_04635 [Chlamydiota bacterium]|jgi:hypothetical protein
MTSIQALPNGLLSSVFSYLSPEEQRINHRVNNLWREVSCDRLGQLAFLEATTGLSEGHIERLLNKPPFSQLIEKILGKTFSLSSDADTFKGKLLSKLLYIECSNSSEGAITFLKNLSPEKRALINELKFHSNHHISDDLLLHFFKLCPNVKSLSIDGAMISGLCFAEMPEQIQLEELALFNCNKLKEDFLKIFFSSKARSLKELNFISKTTGEGLASIPALNRLEKLDLSCSDYLKKDFLKNFFSLKIPELKELYLNGCLSITGEELSYISEQNQLEVITLNSSLNLNEKFLSIFFSKANKLKFVSFSYLDTTCEGLSNIPEDNQLEGLSLNNCKNIKEEWLGRFFSIKSSRLKWVDFNESNTTGQGLSFIPEQNQLEELDCSQCKELNEEFLKIFFTKAFKLLQVSFSLSNTTGEGLSFIPENNQLEELDCSQCKELNEEFLKIFFTKAFKLLQVSLSSSNTTGEGLSFIRKQNQLKKLSLFSCRHLTEDYLKDFFSKAFALQKLNLKNTNTTCEGLSFIPENNQLKELVLINCNSLAEDYLKVFFLKTSMLQKLYLQHSNTTCEGLSFLPEKNILRELSLDFCKNLDEDFLKTFFTSKASMLEVVNFFLSNTTFEGILHLPEENHLELIIVKFTPHISVDFLQRFPNEIVMS